MTKQKQKTINMTRGVFGMRYNANAPDGLISLKVLTTDHRDGTLSFDPKRAFHDRMARFTLDIPAKKEVSHVHQDIPGRQLPPELQVQVAVYTLALLAGKMSTEITERANKASAAQHVVLGVEELALYLAEHGNDFAGWQEFVLRVEKDRLLGTVTLQHLRRILRYWKRARDASAQPHDRDVEVLEAGKVALKVTGDGPYTWKAVPRKGR